MIGYLCSVHYYYYYYYYYIRPCKTADSVGTASVTYIVICSNRNNFVGSLWAERETSIYVEREKNMDWEEHGRRLSRTVLQYVPLFGVAEENIL
jgi:hypothetical protein